MVETVSQSTFNFSSDYTPFTFASTMRTCYANDKASSVSSSSQDSTSNSSSSSNNSTNFNSLTKSPSQCRRSSCNEAYFRNLDHQCNNKRCSNTITTCFNKTNKPKLQLTTTTIEDSQNNLLSSCTTQLSTPQSNGMISQKHQFNFDQSHPNVSFGGANRMTTSNGTKQKRSESFGQFNRQCSELNDNNNNLLNGSFDDNHENSNSSEEDLIFSNNLSCSPSLNPTNHLINQHQPKSPRQTLMLCKRCGSNSSLTSFSSISSSVSSSNNLNQFTLTNCTQAQCSNYGGPNQDNLITNLSHSLNQTFNFANNNLNSNLTIPPFNRSRHNSINSLTLNSNNAPEKVDKNLQNLHKALCNIFESF